MSASTPGLPRRVRQGAAAVALVFAGLALVGLQPARSQEIPRFPTRGWFDFKAPAVKDPVLQHAKETFIKYGCAYCHNVDLHPRGEAADLMHSPIVAADVDGEAISQILKAGIPQTAKLSPMPQFSDLSETEMKDIARWIHYARMEGRFAELMQAGERPGNAAVGRTYFAEECAACHQASTLKAALRTTPLAGFKAAVLKPAVLEATTSFRLPVDAAAQKARARHSALLENFTEDEVANLLAYLRQRG